MIVTESSSSFEHEQAGKPLAQISSLPLSPDNFKGTGWNEKINSFSSSSFSCGWGDEIFSSHHNSAAMEDMRGKNEKGEHREVEIDERAWDIGDFTPCSSSSVPSSSSPFSFSFSGPHTASENKKVGQVSSTFPPPVIYRRSRKGAAARCSSCVVQSLRPPSVHPPTRARSLSFSSSSSSSFSVEEAKEDMDEVNCKGPVSSSEWFCSSSSSLPLSSSPSTAGVEARMVHAPLLSRDGEGVRELRQRVAGLWLEREEREKENEEDGKEEEVEGQKRVEGIDKWSEEFESLLK